MTLVSTVLPLIIVREVPFLDVRNNTETVMILFFLFILRKGIPKALSSNKRCSKIGEHFCLPVEKAVQLYEQDSPNTRLKRPEVYGDDS